MKTCILKNIRQLHGCTSFALRVNCSLGDQKSLHPFLLLSPTLWRSLLLLSQLLVAVGSCLQPHPWVGLSSFLRKTLLFLARTAVEFPRTRVSEAARNEECYDQCRKKISIRSLVMSPHRLVYGCCCVCNFAEEDLVTVAEQHCCTSQIAWGTHCLARLMCLSLFWEK